MPGLPNLLTLVNKPVRQSCDPDWKMKNAVKAPMTPVNPRATVGSGAVRPTFCKVIMT